MNFEKLFKKSIKYFNMLNHQYPQKKIKRTPLEDEVFNNLSKLVKNKVSETEMHNFLENNPQIFGHLLGLYRTAHHGFAVYSKQEIIPYIKEQNKGLIPDFIIGGENSDGWQWWVIEIKSPKDSIFIDRGSLHFSDIANKGICQLLEYVSVSDKIQGHLRDHFGFKDFNNPKGILLIGTEDDFKDKRKQNIKKAFNDLMSKRFEIKTFSWLVREIETIKNYHSTGSYSCRSDVMSENR